MLGADGSGSSQEENIDVLRRMAADGDLLTNHRDIEFSNLFSRKESALKFIQAVQEQGYQRSSVEYWIDQLSWLTTVRIRMVPTLEEITEIELELNEIASSCEGRPDGWGCMEIIKSKPMQA